ncbi:MAG: hypothetical protein GWP19_13745 [Planctomycetia bacterium]|nr:hypothetical protein [Planctomycetia bacterium]
MKIPDNPREPTKTNPIKLRKLLVYPDFFTFKKSQYHYEDITKLAFDWYAFQAVSRNTLVDPKIEFNLPGVSKRITIKAVWNPLFDISLKRFEKFYCGYHYMAEKSFTSRYKKYKDEFSEKGYFRYSDELFFKDRVTDGKDWEVMLDDGTKYLKNHKNGILLCTNEKIRGSITRKILPNYSKAVGAFFDDTDIDVLKKLLDEFYGLKILQDT